MTAVELHDAPNQEAILRYLNLDPRNVNTQALLLICQRYRLDPLMKHVVLISGRPYVTRDGYLHIAHDTGQLDGIEVIEEGQSDTEWWAKVAVHRKDMSKPFTYRGRYPFDGMQKKYGPEMAVKTAEVMALRRAFDVTGVGAADEQWDEQHVQVEPLADEHDRQAVKDTLGSLSDEQQADIKAWFKAENLPSVMRMTDTQLEYVRDHLAEMAYDDPSDEEEATPCAYCNEDPCVCEGEGSDGDEMSGSEAIAEGML